MSLWHASISIESWKKCFWKLLARRSIRWNQLAWDEQRLKQRGKSWPACYFFKSLTNKQFNWESRLPTKSQLASSLNSFPFFQLFIKLNFFVSCWRNRNFYREMLTNTKPRKREVLRLIEEQTRNHFTNFALIQKLQRFVKKQLLKAYSNDTLRRRKLISFRCSVYCLSLWTQFKKSKLEWRDEEEKKQQVIFRLKAIFSTFERRKHTNKRRERWNEMKNTFNM